MTVRAIPEDDPLLRVVQKTIASHRMLRVGDRVLVGFSGGPDSTALLLCLHCLAEKQTLSLAAAHFNHGLRGARSEADARHAAAVAAALKVPFIVEVGAVGAYRRIHRMSLEEAGRELRHRFLQKAALEGGYHCIALGHHRDDDAESLLMRFVRGSGPLGLAGIPPKGRGIGGDIPVIRPLIRVPRDALRAFAQRSGLHVVEDESNADRRFLRNRIRHELLPMLTERYNPNLAEGLSRMARVMRDEDDWAGDLASKTLEALLLADHGTFLILDRQALVGCHPALQRRVLRAAVARCKGDLKRLGFAPLEAARRLAIQGPSEGALNLPDGLILRGRGNQLELQRAVRQAGRGRPSQPTTAAAGFSYPIPAMGRYTIPEAGVTMVFSLLNRPPEERGGRSGQQTAFFDMDRLSFPLVVRSFRPGDRLAPLGMQGSQKVKKLFIDRKIARWHRSRIPLLLSGGEIIWIAGLRQGRRGRLVPNTKRWLKVDLIGCLTVQDD